ncbi:MAG: alpha/beta hydrolase [Brevefilum sp.]|nr:alpha/beta hydrolase [Brevefilum sp.]
MKEIKRFEVKKTIRYLLLGALILLLAGAGAFVLWGSNPAQPEALALAAMQTSDGVRFENTDGWLVFEPLDSEPTIGLIFYPGGRVDPRAYAPHARNTAGQGFTVIIVPMPLNLAFFGLNRAGQVIVAFPGIETWAVGGHSLGGAMAAEYVRANPAQVAGLVLWASYPGGNNDLSAADLPVLSVYASNDGLATLEDIADSRARLPLTTTFVEISGGNHAGFGWYGPQNGDGQASLSKPEQQDLIVQATVTFLETLGQ